MVDGITIKTHTRIQTLTENSAKLERAELQNNTIVFQADAKKYAELNSQLQTKLVAATT